MLQAIVSYMLLSMPTLQESSDLMSKYGKSNDFNMRSVDTKKKSSSVINLSITLFPFDINQ